MFVLLRSGMLWDGNAYPYILHYSNVTWRFTFFISVSTCSAWSSI